MFWHIHSFELWYLVWYNQWLYIQSFFPYEFTEINWSHDVISKFANEVFKQVFSSAKWPLLSFIRVKQQTTCLTTQTRDSDALNPSSMSVSRKNTYLKDRIKQQIILDPRKTIEFMVRKFCFPLDEHLKRTDDDN